MAVSDGAFAALLTALGAGSGAGATYLLKRRQSSGTVQTTEAKDLWAEATAFRAAQRDTIADLTADIDRRDEIIKAKDELIDRLRAELEGCYEKLRVPKGSRTSP